VAGRNWLVRHRREWRAELEPGTEGSQSLARAEPTRGRPRLGLAWRCGRGGAAAQRDKGLGMGGAARQEEHTLLGRRQEDAVGWGPRMEGSLETLWIWGWRGRLEASRAQVEGLLELVFLISPSKLE
jgi:hypothetical protein